MRLTAICLALLVISAYSVGVQRPVTNSQMKKIQELKNGNSWGSFIVNLAEVNMLAQGPIQTLIDAINELIGDLNGKLQRTHSEYEKRTTEHNSEVRRLTDEIQLANLNIADTRSHLDNVLNPLKAQLKEDLVVLNREVVDAQERIVSSTAKRNQDNASFKQRVEEHNAALAAIAEALQILSQLEGEASLVQLKKFQHQMDKIKEHLKKSNNIESSFVQALTSLSSSKFTDQSQLKKVVGLLNDLSNNLQKSLVQEAANEEQALADFNDLINRLTNLIASNTQEIAKKSDQLAHTEQEIVAAHEFIEKRLGQLKGFQDDLANENSKFDTATTNFKDLVAQLTNEISGSGAALDVVQGSSFEDYITSRAGQTGANIIDTQHGTGVRVDTGFVGL